MRQWRRVCQTGQVEDEKHFILDCSFYKEVRAKMYRDIDVVMEGKWEGKMRMNDKDWMMDALIGRGVPGRTKEVAGIVMKFLSRIVKMREEYLEKDLDPLSE